MKKDWTDCNGFNGLKKGVGRTCIVNRRPADLSVCSLSGQRSAVPPFHRSTGYGTTNRPDWCWYSIFPPPSTRERNVPSPLRIAVIGLPLTGPDDPRSHCNDA